MYNCPVRWYTVADEISVDEMSVDELLWNPIRITRVNWAIPANKICSLRRVITNVEARRYFKHKVTILHEYILYSIHCAPLKNTPKNFSKIFYKTKPLVIKFCTLFLK